MNTFIFSIIIPIFNSESCLEETIKSVVNQEVGFEENVQLILIDGVNTNESIEIINKYYHIYQDNILKLSINNRSLAHAKNQGLKHSSGEFIGFLDCGDELSENTLSDVSIYFEKNEDIDLLSIPIVFFDKEQDSHFLNYKFKTKSIIDLNEDYECPQLNVSSTFIRKSILKYQFNENIPDDADLLFISEILIDKQKYGLVKESKYHARKQLNQFKSNTNLKKLFVDKVNIVYKSLIDSSLTKNGHILDFIQFIILLDIKQILLFKDIENVFKDSNEMDCFRNSIHQILKYIDEEMILNHKLLNKNIRSFLMYLRNNDFHAEKEYKKILFKSDEYLISKLNNKFQIDVVELKRDVMNISGYFTSNCSNKYLSVEAVLVDNSGLKETFYPTFVDYFDRKNEKYLGIDWIFKYSFDFKIPINRNSLSGIYFAMKYDENNLHFKRKCKLVFGYFANLSNLSNYFVKDSNIVYFYKNSIFIDDYSYKKMCVREWRNLSKIIHSNKKKVLNPILFRLIHLFLFAFLKNKRIWLFQDRLTVADDNAEYLFRYAIDQKDNIKKYYVIQKDCDDFKRMNSNYKNVIAFGSLKHKLLYLFSEKIISSHIDHSVLNPFTKEYNLILLNGLFTIERCFLQHGITKDNMSYWIKKHYVNLFLFVTASDFEYKSIFDEEYNFDEDVVHVFGLPRYDTLNNENIKKQVLFMPTWRSQVRERDLFKKSKHFKRLNNLINNEKLINYLSENDFQLIFKPHFEIMEHIDLFNIPSEVKLSSNDSYQKLFNESSILITDFSSVAFDFAYLKKPIIYYQEDKDYHNSDSYFDYETMGFGEVVKSEDELVDIIIDYINNECQMKEKYLDRVEEFYKFTDKNNCMRIYNWLVENK